MRATDFTVLIEASLYIIFMYMFLGSQLGAVLYRGIKIIITLFSPQNVDLRKRHLDFIINLIQMRHN